MSWKKTLATVAPTIATALGSPVAGTAVKFLADKFLLDGEEATEVNLEQFVLNSNPEQLAQIKSADNEFKLEMERLGVDVFKLEVQDRDSARTNHKHSYTPAILVYMLTLLITGVTYLLFNQIVPESNENTLYMLLGALTTAWLQSVSYWTGTTRSSSEKNASFFSKPNA